ncbi:MAG TPA: ubiquinol-cytochrome c reductase iron-sulfur subunit [Solirubrobacteraceae bacterium]
MADKSKKNLSKYTVDLNMPGAFEGETVTRRNFMNITAQGFGIAATLAFTLPALGFALGPVFSREPFEWQIIGRPEDFQPLVYSLRVITLVPNVGEAGKTTVYVRQRDTTIDTEKPDEYNQIVAISSRCSHLGCPVRWVESAGRFLCPCHGGIYDFRGVRVGGPPVRPLNRFYTLIRNGYVYVGPMYSVNIELRRFSNRDPGQPLDGIGQYLYPSRFSTSVLPPTTNLPLPPPGVPAG